MASGSQPVLPGPLVKTMKHPENVDKFEISTMTKWCREAGLNKYPAKFCVLAQQKKHTWQSNVKFTDVIDGETTHRNVGELTSGIIGISNGHIPK